MNTIRMLSVEPRVPYAAGLAWQRDLARAKIAGELDSDLVLLLEHEPVVTTGRGGRAESLLASPEELAGAGVAKFEVERGGDLTYHGPGQLVGYPILDLTRWKRDLHWYLRQLENVLIRALGELGAEAFRVPGYTGVWVGDPAATSEDGRRAGMARKIASLGVHVSRWVTWHGFALNVTDEPLRRFDLIVPCGISGVRMTSLQSEGAVHDRDSVEQALGLGFADAFESEVRRDGVAEIGGRPEAARASRVG